MPSQPSIRRSRTSHCSHRPRSIVLATTRPPEFNAETWQTIDPVKTGTHERSCDGIGHNWGIPATTGRRTIRYALYDTSFWKSFLQARLAVSMGDRGCLSLFGRDVSQHRGFAEYLTAEYRVRTSGRGSGSEVDEWKLRPEASDNHWLDCVVGACVGATMQDVELLRVAEQKAQPRKRLRLSEISKAARPGR